jgi:hypothetical protein
VVLTLPAATPVAPVVVPTLPATANVAVPAAHGN